ncbi:hypothetical protein HMPREF9555_00187 [Selenomonas artemidis F0399]|uniref:Uncharacterized protein n=1 Tax=Selenomonas artemidis F0399 TaxID=749551 RepID=E7MZP5_9FIRM|nr:hypothetical protein HMPREF9555_00187 [Selenomonas artemidis F0399]EJP30932.1 hypothetical protein HMPREF1147_1490 [Selenomonas sp. FOBRC9]
MNKTNTFIITEKYPLFNIKNKSISVLIPNTWIYIWQDFV